MPERRFLLEKSGPVARLTLSRPDRDNALDGRALSELAAACDDIEADEEVRVLVLAAAGAAFSRGWDRDAIAGEAATGARLLEAMREQGLMDDPFGCLARLSQPVVCALNGDALGAGLALALACDVRVAAEDAQLGLPDDGMGPLPVAGATQRLTRLVGRGKALEMLLTGGLVDAQEALRVGLVTAVAPPGKALESAEAIAHRIAERGPLAVRFAKEAVWRGTEMPLEQALRFETDLTVILQTTEDRAEGVRAFLEKRRPEFKGR
jgi:enoyl-CoA hydratase